MKQLLADYRFSDTLRYEGRRLIYGTTIEEQMEIGGFLGAAVLGALLQGEDEGIARGVVLNTNDGRQEFFKRYKDETISENGGLFSTEVQVLRESYIELGGDMTVLFAICGNDRRYDLAIGLMVEYMKRLTEEEVGHHIYDIVPWREPFAQWLYDAGFVETRRQYLLAIDWTDPAAVFALAELLQHPQEETEPTFVFAGLSAEQVVSNYWEWLWGMVQQDANLYPDAKARMAEYKQYILNNEEDWSFIKPRIVPLQPADINLFEKWMSQWTDFLHTQIRPTALKERKKTEEQLFFPDDVLNCPTEDMAEKYAATREYVNERKKYDKQFANFVKTQSHAKLCRQLTLLFGWDVDPSSLRKSLLRTPKRTRKKYT